jgi:hypothetical protein
LERATDAAERRRINTVGARNVRLRFAVAKPLNGFFARREANSESCAPIGATSFDLYQEM